MFNRYGAKCEHRGPWLKGIEKCKKRVFFVHFWVYLRMGTYDFFLKKVCYVKLTREFEYISRNELGSNFRSTWTFRLSELLVFAVFRSIGLSLRLLNYIIVSFRSTWTLWIKVGLYIEVYWLKTILDLKLDVGLNWLDQYTEQIRNLFYFIYFILFYYIFSSSLVRL